MLILRDNNAAETGIMTDEAGQHRGVSKTTYVPFRKGIEVQGVDVKGNYLVKNFMNAYGALICFVGIILFFLIWSMADPYPRHFFLPQILKCQTGYEQVAVAGGAACVHLKGPLSVNKPVW